MEIASAKNTAVYFILTFAIAATYIAGLVLTSYLIAICHKNRPSLNARNKVKLWCAYGISFIAWTTVFCCLENHFYYNYSVRLTGSGIEWQDWGQEQHISWSQLRSVSTTLGKGGRPIVTLKGNKEEYIVDSVYLKYPDVFLYSSEEGGPKKFAVMAHGGT
jgi:hypothetical protein